MLLELEYKNISMVETDQERSNIALSISTKRKPVYFSAKVTNPMLFRQGLQALGAVIHNDDTWYTEYEFKQMMLDPVITVHPDEIFFEAFSQDESSYGRLSLPRVCFEDIGDVECGTTNIDFTREFSMALEYLRSSKKNYFTVGQKVVELEVSGVSRHKEKKVKIPENWVKGFLQLQAGLTLPAVSFDLTPAELLNVIWFLKENKAKISPRAMRFELRKEEPVELILEPWEQKFIFKKAKYEGTDRTIRVWGRRRLRILEHILPYSDKVTVYICGRGLPSFYVCHLEYGGTFTLALSGWTANDWSKGSSFTSLMPQGFINDIEVENIRNLLVESRNLSVDQVIEKTGYDKKKVIEGLFKLCRSGQCIYDLTSGGYRDRQLFSDLPDMKEIFPEDENLKEANRLIEEEKVELLNIEELNRPNIKKYINPNTGEQESKEIGVISEVRITAKVTDSEEGELETRVSVNDEGRIVFGRCKCKFFDYNLLSRGPCKHIQAVNILYVKRAGQITE